MGYFPYLPAGQGVTDLKKIFKNSVFVQWGGLDLCAQTLNILAQINSRQGERETRRQGDKEKDEQQNIEQ
jgi:hypothetical protein